MYSHNLLSKYPIASDQISYSKLVILLDLLEKKLSNFENGSIVEFGCYMGTTSVFIRRMLDLYGAPHEFHVYDSFAGLPQKSNQDQSPAGSQYIKGELAATKRQFIEHFRRQNLPLPTIHKSWFSELNPRDIPDDIIFAFLDGDFYDSIRDSLELITPKLITGAVIVIDDYANEALPGAGRAVDEWALGNRQTVISQNSLGIIRLHI